MGAEPQFLSFDLTADVRLVHNYLTSMVDSRLDFLPYWLIGANENPAWAQHCRVDDAELVGSWYEALCCAMKILNTDAGSDVLRGFQRHLLKSWGEHGLRFHEPYPWTHTLHSSFHEMGYILSAMVRWHREEPENQEVQERMRNLIQGMHSLVIKPETITFWAGDFPFEETIYRFPNDIYIQGKGWDYSRVTGRGEESIRNAVMLHPLVQAYELTGDEAALDLAIGTANYLLGISRYFNYKREYFGHVHSALWVAAGLALLGRLIRKPWYVRCARQILDYTLSLSSSYGWVPEYAQWHPQGEEHCETCCIKSAIFAGYELTQAGYPEYWDTINRFTRNMLSENQVKDGSFVGVDNSLADTEDMTFRDIDKRIVGGFSGGTLPNSLSVSRFRSIAGCCVGTAPQALHLVWQHILEEDSDTLTVNLPIGIERNAATLTTGYPNEGWLKLQVRSPRTVRLRIHPFMHENLRISNGDREVPVCIDDEGVVTIPGVTSEAALFLTHQLKTEIRTETFGGGEYTASWRGSDVVELLPEGEPIRLFQRRAGQPAEIPPPPPRMDGQPKGFDARPTQQKR